MTTILLKLLATAALFLLNPVLPFIVWPVLWLMDSAPAAITATLPDDASAERVAVTSGCASLVGWLIFAAAMLVALVGMALLTVGSDCPTSFMNQMLERCP